MAKITNPSLRDVKLPTGHVVPLKGSLTVTNDVLRENAAMLNGLALSGAITFEYDREPDPTGAVVAVEVPTVLPAVAELNRVMADLADAAAEVAPVEAPKAKK